MTSQFFYCLDPLPLEGGGPEGWGLAIGSRAGVQKREAIPIKPSSLKRVPEGRVMTRAKRGFLFTPAGRLYGFLNTKREMAYVSHSSFITRHPERSRRIYSAIAVYLATDSVAFLLFHQQGTCSNLLRQFLGFTAIAV